MEGATIATDASLLGGGAVLRNTLHDYRAKRPLVAYLRIRWANVHEDIVSATVGHENYQARWEALQHLGHG